MDKLERARELLQKWVDTLTSHAPQSTEDMHKLHELLEDTKKFLFVRPPRNGWKYGFTDEEMEEILQKWQSWEGADHADFEDDEEGKRFLSILCEYAVSNCPSLEDVPTNQLEHAIKYRRTGYD